MADNTAQEATDTGLSDATDTSTTEDSAVDYDSDDIFDDIDVSDAPTVDDEDSDDDEAATESTEETESDAADDVEESEDSSDQADAEETTTVSEDERKRHNDEMAKARIAEREARQRAAEVEREAEESNIQRYLDEARDDEVELEKRQNEVVAYRNLQEKAELNQDKLIVGFQRAQADISLFKTGTPAVQERLNRAIDRFERENVRFNQRGQIVEMRGDLYSYLQAEANSIEAEREELRQELVGKLTKDKQKQQTRTVQPGSRAPKVKSDPGIDAFDEEANKY